MNNKQERFRQIIQEEDSKVKKSLGLLNEIFQIKVKLENGRRVMVYVDAETPNEAMYKVEESLELSGEYALNLAIVGQVAEVPLGADYIK